MPLDTILMFLVFGLAAGLLIGCVGIGGVILVPLLSYVGGIDIRIAIAAAMFAYLISGVVGTTVYAQQKSLRWDMTRPMWLGAMPAALAGALAVQILPGSLLELCIGVLAAASGIHALFEPSEDSSAPQVANNDQASSAPLAPSTAASMGGVTGFTSALTGTGGPLVLIPILLWFRVPVLTAVGLGVAIQLPIAALATMGNLYSGTLNFKFGCLLGAGILFGTWAGARLAHKLPRTILRKIVSTLLVLVGAFILLKLAITMQT